MNRAVFIPVPGAGAVNAKGVPHAWSLRAFSGIDESIIFGSCCAFVHGQGDNLTVHNGFGNFNLTIIG